MVGHIAREIGAVLIGHQRRQAARYIGNIYPEVGLPIGQARCVPGASPWEVRWDVRPFSALLTLVSMKSETRG
jgi:hypothetical protein